MWCVRWYLRYPIAVAQMGEMARERGLAISPSCVWRWVQTYGPELDKRCRRPLKPTNRSGSSRPAYPAAVDELKKDGTMGRRCQLRQCKYLNNVVAQDHRNVKCRTWLAKGYGAVRTAWRTLRGIEAMGMIGKGRVRRAGKGEWSPR
jgi:transposase-like protein